MNNKTIVMVVGEVSQFLKFSQDLRVAPYKKYISGAEAADLAHRLHLTDRKPTIITQKKLCPTIEFLTGTAADTDRGGSYTWSSINPQAKFGAFRRIGDFMPGSFDTAEFNELVAAAKYAVFNGHWGACSLVLLAGVQEDETVHFYEIEPPQGREAFKLPVRRLRALVKH